MEVDSSDVDFELINRLNTLGTRDKEELLAEFQSIVGNQMSPGCCTFYLEMGRWNLQTALCAYYDVMSSPEQLPNITLEIESIHIQENSVRPGQKFVKLWKLKNTGFDQWPNNFKLKFIKGYNFGHAEVVALPPIGASETTDVSVEMIAPQGDGLYQAQWRAVTISGHYCGSTLTVSINVDSSNVSSLADQMSKLGQNEQMEQMSSTSDSSLCPPITDTPYCSPTGHGIFSGTTTNNLTSHIDSWNMTSQELVHNNSILENSEHSEQSIDDNDS